MRPQKRALCWCAFRVSMSPAARAPIAQRAAACGRLFGSISQPPAPATRALATAGAAKFPAAALRFQWSATLGAAGWPVPLFALLAPPMFTLLRAEGSTALRRAEHANCIISADPAMADDATPDRWPGARIGNAHDVAKLVGAEIAMLQPPCTSSAPPPRRLRRLAEPRP
jgi:hypothetical protein